MFASALCLHTSDSDIVSCIPVVFVSLDVRTLEDSCPPVLILCIISQSEYEKNTRTLYRLLLWRDLKKLKYEYEYFCQAHTVCAAEDCVLTNHLHL